MGLSKLIHRPEMNEWAQKKAVEVINAIPSQDLILEAYLFGSAVDGSFCKKASPLRQTSPFTRISGVTESPAGLESPGSRVCQLWTL